MKFGPLELQACGENNFTMKALGLLAFRPDLRSRLIRDMFEPTFEGSDSTILFFSRVGEDFFREAIARDARDGSLEARLNQTLDLPENLRWSRNADGRLTQPAKWQEHHIARMLASVGAHGDLKLRDRLSALQNCFNTEPDVVMQWDSTMAFIEVKVLSGEGTLQLGRQQELGEFISSMLGWTSRFAFVGPSYSGGPSAQACTFRSWQEISELFDDVEEISDYVRSFAFYYRGAWRSMIDSHADQPGSTAYDVFMARPTTSAIQSSHMSAALPATDVTTAHVTPWHFSHLGRTYFERVRYECRSSGHWPVKWVWTGTTGVPYAERSNGRMINANWMVQTISGHFRTNGRAERYNPGKMGRWAWEDVSAHFHLDRP